MKLVGGIVEQAMDLIQRHGFSREYAHHLVYDELKGDKNLKACATCGHEFETVRTTTRLCLTCRSAGRRTDRV